MYQRSLTTDALGLSYITILVPAPFLAPFDLSRPGSLSKQVQRLTYPKLHTLQSTYNIIASTPSQTHSPNPTLPILRPCTHAKNLADNPKHPHNNSIIHH